MKVRDVMTQNPTWCTPDTSLHEVAQMMMRADCGAIPVCDEASKQAVGIITDRDIVVRAIASGEDTRTLCARDCMTSPVVTITDDTDVDDCLELMEAKQIRRMLVMDRTGGMSGIVAQADLAQHLGKKATGEMVREVSESNGVRPHLS